MTTASLPSLEIHVPISADPLFFNMVHYLARSVRHFGGEYANAKIVVTIGADTIDQSLAERIPWLSELGISLNWVPIDRYATDSFYATAVERFSYPFESDMVLMLDADILVACPFTEMVLRLYEEQAFGGVVALMPPLPQFKLWQDIYDHCGLGTVIAEHEHLGWGYYYSDQSLRFCPPYFNLGALCAPSSVMSKIGSEVYDLMHRNVEIYETIYRCQIAVSLAITKFGIPIRSLPHRYNFPNDPMQEAMNPQEWPNATFIHLFRRNQGVYKGELFQSFEQVEAVIARTDLRCINEKAQELLRVIHPQVLSDPVETWPHGTLPGELTWVTQKDGQTSQESQVECRPADVPKLTWVERVVRRLKLIWLVSRFGHL